MSYRRVRGMIYDFKEVIVHSMSHNIHTIALVGAHMCISDRFSRLFPWMCRELSVIKMPSKHILSILV